MGFFSEIASEARRGIIQPQPPAAQAVAAKPPTITKPEPAPPVATETPTAQPIPGSIPIAHEVVEPVHVHVPPEPEVPAPTPVESKQAPTAVPEPPRQPVEPPSIDLSADADAADEAERKRAHEAAEAKRKAEFDKAQAEKRAAAQAELDRIAAMPDADAQAAAASMIASGIERITRRNMKEAVAAYLSDRAMSDPAFAKACLRPGKTLQAVFKRINEKAKEYLKEEAEAAGETPSGMVGGDVPDDVVYGWAESFMLEPPAEPDEKFVPKPYIPSTRNKSKTKATKKKPEQKKPAPEKPKPKAPALEQASLF